MGDEPRKCATAEVWYDGWANTFENPPPEKSIPVSGSLTALRSVPPTVVTKGELAGKLWWE